MPARTTSSSCASAGVNASSPARTSTSCPPARSRARPSAGSTRVVMTMRAFSERCEKRMVDRGQAFVVRHGVQVVEHDHEPALIGRGGVHQLVHDVLDRAAQRPEPPQRDRPSPGRTRSTAVATYRHSRPGSLSPASSVIQARADPSAAHQERTAVVLPYPGGAATSVTGASRPPRASAEHAADRGCHGGDEARRAWPRRAVETLLRPRRRAGLPPAGDPQPLRPYRRTIATSRHPGDGFANTRVIAELRADRVPRKNGQEERGVRRQCRRSRSSG